MYGYTRDELLRLTPLDLVISEGESYAFEKIRNVLSGKQSVFENTHKRKTGEEIPVEISPHLFDLDGRPTILSRVLDITEHKRSEKERQNLLARLQQSQKMEAVGTLAGGIAHDFNNILAVILGNAELASDDVPDWNPASKSLKEIHKASIRAKDMVQQLLAFSRKTDEVSMPINIAPIIKESLKMLKHAIPTSVEFKQHISDDSCNVMGDASQINQIVMNLVTNAADAMSEEGGLLKVTLENIILQEEKICFDWVLSPGPYVRLRMRDTGEGIEPKIMDRIFEPYYTTKEVGKGTGMGLSVIHGIMKRHNGGIRVESEVEKGTLFEIYFPALEKAAEEEKKPEGEIKGGSERILFVDDEESMVNLNHQRLERLGYTVKSTTKPVEALEWFRADPGQFDVIITDMTMPRMTGDRLTKEVLTIRPHMPVIICTGYSERMSAKKAEGLGVRKYLEKPIGLRNMASALREVLDDGPMSVVPT
jgi:signal transduction histidine kinase/CheY-like chemotaxis protein